MRKPSERHAPCGRPLLEASASREAKTLLREGIPVARRVLGEGNRLSAQNEVVYYEGCLQRILQPPIYPRGRDDARGHGTDRAPCLKCIRSSD